ncbi:MULTISPECIES: hypothetical protein [Hydrocarboniphaga]|uniref:hypothetical protein n=1 Tax=Hydrocarboniphaga TaxID=243627 RepID=UPI00058C31C2|nr:MULTISPECIES: hypothetical protein [Hydrocarboniphaga]MDZ4076775.1 hypothetical protein [Hydrocarboniphaga sp.]
MGSEIALLIVLPGLGVFAWLSYRTLTGPLPDRALYLVALLAGLMLGVSGMVSAYRPDIPENWNTSFLVGWFLMSASFWLIVATGIALLCIFVLRKFDARATGSNADRPGPSAREPNE